MESSRVGPAFAPKHNRTAQRLSSSALQRVFEFRNKSLFLERDATQTQIYFAAGLKYLLVFASTCQSRGVASFLLANERLSASLFTISVAVFACAVLAETAYVFTRWDWWVVCYKTVRNPLFNVFFPLLSILAGEQLSGLRTSLSYLKPGAVFLSILAHRLYTGSLSNCLPFSSLESAIRLEEYFIDLVLYSAQFAHMMLHRSGEDLLAYQSTAAVTLLAFAALLLLFCRTGVYFSVDFNKLHAVCLAFLLLFKAFDIAQVRDASTRHCFLFVALVTSPAVARLVGRASSWNTKIDVFDPRLSPTRLYHGCVLLHKYILVQASACSSEQERELLLYYQGLWVSQLRRADPDACLLSLTPAQHTQKLVQFLVSHPVLKSNSIVLKLTLILHATLPAYFYHSVNQLLKALAKNYSSSLSHRYCLHLIRAVWEAKLKAIEIGALSAKSQSDVNVFQVMDPLKIVIDLDRSTAAISQQSIQHIFDSVEKFKALADLLEATFAKQGEIYEFLDKEESLAYARLQHLNRSTLSLRREMCRSISEQAKAEAIYSYFYPTIMTCCCVVMHDFAATSAFLQAYKHKLSVLLDRTTHRSSYSLTERLETDSVVIKVALEKEQIGVITSVSLNVNHFLGEFEKEELLGKSVNCFLPEQMAEVHLETMQSEKVIPILNKNRPFLINDLHGNLKEVIMTIKLASQTSSSVCGYGLMTFETKFKGPSLLLDDQLNILSSNSTFTRLLEQLGFHRAVQHRGEVNLSELSPKLGCSIRDVKKLIEYIATAPELKSDLDFAESQDSSDQVKSKLHKYLKAIVEENRTSGLVYGLGPESPLAKILGSPFIHARFEVGSMLGRPIIRAFISTKVGEDLFRQLKEARDDVRGSAGSPPGNLSLSESSNKVVRLRQTDLDDLDSENKLSFVDLNLHDRAAQDNASNRKISLFEDCLAPAGQLVRAASSFLKRRNTIREHGAAEDSQLVDFRNLNSAEDLFFDQSPVKRDILSLLKRRKTSFEQPDEPRPQANPKARAADRHQIHPLGSAPRKESHNTTDKDNSLSSNTMLNRNNHRPRENSLKKPTGQSSHPPKQIFRKERTTSNHSFLSHPPQRKPRDLRKVRMTTLSTGYGPFAQAGQKSDTPKTNVATYKTISRLIALLNVASLDAEQAPASFEPLQ